ncbi:hypothetical protein TELCIR_08241, partial [Teladorsagia circumcincta]
MPRFKTNFKGVTWYDGDYASRTFHGATENGSYGLKRPNSKRTMNHVDVDQLLEDYAWAHFKDIQSLRRTRLDDFKSLERDDCEFIINRRNLMWINEEPQYTEFIPVGAKPYTLFKSIYTNNTNRPQEYSFKTERTTESLCSISREQGYSMGAEAELTLKTPCEIAELKAGFKHEMHFNSLNENCQTEILTWGVDSNVQVKQVVTIDQRKVVRLLSKGTCHFQ